MNNLKLPILSFLTIFFVFSCTSDSNVVGGNTDKNYLSSLPAAESDERETRWDAFYRVASREPVK